jgi:signal transduction histidine kinase
MVIAFFGAFLVIGFSLVMFKKKSDPRIIKKKFKSAHSTSTNNSLEINVFGPKINTLDVFAKTASSMKELNSLNTLFEQGLLANKSLPINIPGINLIKMFAEIISSMTEFDNIDVLMRQILSAMIKATGAKYGCLVWAPSMPYNNNSIAISFEGDDIEIAKISISNSLIEKVYHTKTIQLHERNATEEGSVIDCDNRKSDMCVPLIWRDKYLGYVYLVNDKARGLFNEGAKMAAEILMMQAGIVLGNAELMSQYKELNIQLQHKMSDQMNEILEVNKWLEENSLQLQHKMIDQMDDIMEKNKELEDNTVKLVDSERMKNLLTGALVHDIKNYVTAIQGNIKLFEMKFPENEKVKRTSIIVTNSCVDILNLTSNLLDISKMEEGKLEVKKELLTIDHIGAMIEKCKANDIFTQREISIEVKLPKNRFEIEADYDLLERVFQNLFSNAVKYSPKGGKIVLSFLPREKENIISFYNSGTPIPDGSKENIFEKYGRLNADNSYYSKGLGLFFCKMVLNAHRGRIWVETDENGNYFKMSFNAHNYIGL